MDENGALRELVQQSLLQVCDQFSNVTYYPMKIFVSHRNVFFKDPYHVDHDSGFLLAQEIIERVKEP